MLPFARMLEYGNIKPQNQVKDIQVGFACIYVLYDNGNLYGGGSNSHGQLGVPGTAVSELTLIDTGVTKLAKNMSGPCMAYAKGTRIYGMGSQSFWNLTSTRWTVPTMFINVSSIVGSSDFDLHITEMNMALHVLETNLLYLSGRGGVGYAGVQDSVSNLTQFAGTYIKSLCLSNYNIYAYSTGKSLIGTGSNSSKQVQNSTTGSFNTWVTITSNISRYSSENRRILWINDPPYADIWGGGSNSLNALGAGSGSTVFKNIRSVNPTTALEIYNMYNASVLFAGVGNAIGTPGIYAMGDGRTFYSWSQGDNPSTEFVLCAPLNSYDLISVGTYSTIYVKDGRLFTCNPVSGMTVHDVPGNNSVKEILLP